MAKTVRSVLAACFLLSSPVYADVQQSASSVHNNSVFAYVVIGIVVFCALFALMLIRRGLGASDGWSLGDAVSEEADLTTDTGVAIKVMKASASRLIALAGLTVMLFLYMGFGVFILYDFATGHAMPTELDAVEKFMLAGLGMFAPYAVNQLRAAMDGLTAAAPKPAPTTVAGGNVQPNPVVTPAQPPMPGAVIAKAGC